jgi:hypothetical protein
MGDSQKWRLDEALSVPERKERVKEASMHYGEYAKSLEAAHYGEFVAIAPDGRLIDGSVLLLPGRQAIEYAL